MKRLVLLLVAVVLLGAIIIIALKFFHNDDKAKNHTYFNTKTFQRDELKYFIETACYDNGYIIKWDRDITVQILDGASKTDTIVIQEMLREVSPVLGRINISLVDSGGNLTIRFVKDEAEYKKLAAGIFHEGFPGGYTLPSLNIWKTKIRDVSIVMSPTASERDKRKILRHELGHALGLWQHPRSFYETPNIMGRISVRDIDAYMKWTDSPYFSRLDISALKMLYNDSLPNATLFKDLIEPIDTTAAQGVQNR